LSLQWARYWAPNRVLPAGVVRAARALTIRAREDSSPSMSRSFPWTIWTSRWKGFPAIWSRSEPGDRRPTSTSPVRVVFSGPQSTVAAGVPCIARSLRRFPPVSAVAEADEADVLKAWEGLGYYRRARQLHEAARSIVRDHGGVFPDDPEKIRALPGVGRYIAG